MKFSHWTRRKTEWFDTST